MIHRYSRLTKLLLWLVPPIALGACQSELERRIEYIKDRLKRHSEERASMVKETRERAGQGDADARFNVGQWYETGVFGFPQSDTLALKWYRKAAEQNHYTAEFMLYQAYDLGRGVRRMMPKPRSGGGDGANTDANTRSGRRRNGKS